MSIPKKGGLKSVYIKNRPATYEYAIEDKLVAGMVLAGTEIKSIRQNKVSFADSFCQFHNDELWVLNLHIGEYTHAQGTASHAATRERKLLLNKKELLKWQHKIKEKGFTIVPLSLFITEKGFAKLHIGLGRGKKLHDKRNTIKDREANRALKESGF